MSETETARAAVKDPLDATPSSYDILGVAPGASTATIEAAFKARLSQRSASPKQLTDAWRALLRPVDRTLIDVLHYRAADLCALTPNPLDNPAALDASQRSTTANRWQAHFRQHFGDLPTAHCLTVLHYWSAFDGSRHVDHATADGHRPSAEEHWRSALAYLGLLIANPEFWTGHLGLEPTVAAEAKPEFVKRLGNTLEDLAQQHQRRGTAAVAQRFAELKLLFQNEIRTAEQMAEVGVRYRGGRKLVCGPLLLEKAGLLPTIRQQVDALAREAPRNAKLRELATALSPFGAVRLLLEQRNPQGALDAIAALPEASRTQPEAAQLKARALHEIGAQQASVRLVEEALASWKEALQHAGPSGSELHTKIVADVVAACKERVAALTRQRQLEEAERLLERAIAVVPDQGLKLLLAELITDRAIGAINRVQTSAQSSTGALLPADADALRRSVADLERARDLGSTRATSQLDVAQTVAAELTSGTKLLVERAHAAATEQDWNTAISLLRDALLVATSRTAEGLRANLAVCLSNRAGAAVDSALSQAKGALSTAMAGRPVTELWEQQALTLGLTLLGAAERDLREAAGLSLPAEKRTQLKVDQQLGVIQQTRDLFHGILDGQPLRARTLAAARRGSAGELLATLSSKVMGFLSWILILILVVQFLIWMASCFK